jgi:hypothetical protein
MHGIVAALAVVLTGQGSQSPSEVIVDATRIVRIGETEEISSNLFGITAFEGFPRVVSDPDFRALIEALRPGCFRFPSPLSWFAPETFDPKWYASPAAARQFQETLLHGARYPVGRFFRVARQMGSESMITLNGPPKYLAHEGNATHLARPGDFDRWAEYCAAFVGLCKSFDPQLRLVQVWNEPNADWFNDSRARQKGPARLFIEMTNKLAPAIKRRYPDVLVGGPTLCWPPSWPPSQAGQSPWYTWEGWTLPWLRETKATADFFDFHDYTASPDELAVQVEMLHAAALQIQGRRLPIWVTESNAGLEALPNPAAVWNRRILPYERWLLKGVLPQADKIAGNLYHDMSNRTYELGQERHGAYWLLWILRDLRGRRVVADTADRDLVALATLEEDCVTLVLFNDSPRAKTIPLTVRMPCVYWTGPDVRAIGEGTNGACTQVPVQADLRHEGSSLTKGTVSLPARATASIDLRMDQFGRPGYRRTIREYFGSRTFQFLKRDESVNLVISMPDRKTPPARVALRVGLLGPEGRETFTARLNGRELPLKAAILQEIPWQAQHLRRENQLQITLRSSGKNDKLAVGFAAIVIQDEE